ncbi:MAG: HAMP domain-containing histidine kinase [Prevotella sp.]|nr:HAMP domain-containing histidine kinase [Prevotella sp.]
MVESIIIGGIIVVAGHVWLLRHQRSLRRRAELMQEAVRNKDFMFRLPTNGLLSGERAMQEALNRLGSIVRQQVNQNEVESWERLTRVLTHEIMNAMAPVTSLAQSMLTRPDVKGTPVEEGLHAIYSTSHHLTTFVDSYRKLSQLQQPAPTDVNLQHIAGTMAQLYPAIGWHVNADEGMLIHTDADMLQQVMVNLTKNAVEAGATQMCIETGYDEERGDLLVALSNNGEPIPPEARASVFVPFFTTKRTGNGIGLSLSRRLLTIQGGSLELAERPHSGYHTTFVLRFPDR